MTSNCVICNKPFNEGSVIEVKSKGLATLRQCSTEKNDGKLDLLRGMTSVVIHDMCRKYYTNKKLITPAQRRSSDISSHPGLRSGTPKFSYRDNCFLCAQEINKDFMEKQKKLPYDRREIVYEVRNVDMKDTVIDWARTCGDDWRMEIVNRIQSCHDLVAADAKYHNSCMKKLYRVPTVYHGTTSKKRGRDKAANVEEAMEYIYSYMEEHSEECQFSLSELMNQIKGEYCPDIRTVKERLLKKYGDDIIIAITANKSSVVCYRHAGYKLLTDSCSNKRKYNLKEERLHIVQAAANIVLEDIRSQVYEINHYPPSDRFLQEVDTLVPKTLSIFLESVIRKNKRGELDRWNVKCSAIAHAIISAARPRSFLSPLQIGVASFLYKKYASKQLIEVLSSLGFCSSYKETTLFEVSAIMRPEITIESKAFSQFVFDNADFNTNTLDGLDTFHAMGGIHCVTPGTAITPDQNIIRLTRMPSAKVVGDFGTTSLKIYRSQKETGLKTIKIGDLASINPLSETPTVSCSDLLWLYGKWANFSFVPGWNGFMEEATKNQLFVKSQVICLPFINAPPSDYDTVFTVLSSAHDKCKSLRQGSCIVTFDQPLYIKARDIVAAEEKFNNVVVRLGGFHLLMSFMGSIGYIMAGSGLKDVLSIIYAPISVDKMMTGHAYARALRAHILTHLALAKIILQSLDFAEDDKVIIENFLHNTDKTVIVTANEHDSFQIIIEKFEHQLVQMENRGPTAKLWVQYYRMVTLVKQFIEAERMGNWKLHLNTVQKMLPYFHASGHFLYAKSSHLYLQDMFNLKEKMSPKEYELFTSKGFFTIRRSDKFWSGIWSDMTIEQTLMKTMKSIGGLTHGRGIKDSVLARWTLGMVFLNNVCEEIERFCNISFTSSEQHVDMRSSRVIRDNADVQKLTDWFNQHVPFPEIQEIMSLSTGLVGDERVNCHKSLETGTTGILKIVGRNYESVKFKRTERVTPLGAITASIRMDDIAIPIDPMLIFRRICIMNQSEEELQKYLEYELAPFPLSLFTEQGMRKTAKSSLYKIFSPFMGVISAGDNIYVIDGGYLLHRVIWHRQKSFASICTTYIEFVKTHYSPNAVIVFDGYPEGAANRSTKSSERARRSRICYSVDVLFDDAMVPIVSQEKFLANENNKRRFITMLTARLKDANFVVKQATEDADTLIVNTALSMSRKFDNVIIVAEDVDILVLLIALSTTQTNVYLLKPGRGQIPQKIYSPFHQQEEKSINENVLFLHAFSGCDTTSALFNQGKIKFFNLLKKHVELTDIIKIFKEPSASSAAIAEAGEHFLLKLYGSGSKKVSLDEYRYTCFRKSLIKSRFNLASLPPTTAAAQQHSFRTYHQVQLWYGTQKECENWGWKRGKTGLVPITTLKDPAPEVLLKLISCKCKKGCMAACSCVKAGLKCSVICVNCNGSSCKNVQEPLHETEAESEDEISPLLDNESEYFREIGSDSDTEPGPSGTKQRRVE